MNLVIVSGNLVKDPEIREVNGKAYAEFDLAINEFYNNKNITNYFKVCCYNNLANYVGKYIKKGKNVVINGYIFNNEYISKSGEKKKNTMIMARQIECPNLSSNKDEQPKKDNIYEMNW